jgi:serine/threonine-protein kinase
LNLQCTAAPPALSAEVRRGLPKGVEELLFSLLEKDPDKRPASARVVSERLSPFCAAGASLGTSAPRAVSGARDKTDSKKDTPAPKDKSEKAEASATKRDADTSENDEKSEKGEKTETPRLDTIALIEKKTDKKEVPSWLAISAIIGLSIAAFATTYLVRTKMAEAPAPRDVVTAVASPR